jgi:hypothetical protein
MVRALSSSGPPSLPPAAAWSAFARLTSSARSAITEAASVRRTSSSSETPFASARFERARDRVVEITDLEAGHVRFPERRA